MPVYYSRLKLVFILLLLTSVNGYAQDVVIPLKLEHRFIEQVLKDQLFKSRKQSFRVNDDGSGCNFLELANPRVDNHDARLRIKTDTWARIGQKVGESCLLLLDWKGQTDFYNEAILSNNGRALSINVVDIKLFNTKREPDQATTQLWQWFKQYIYPAMDNISIDLSEPLDGIKDFLPTFIGHGDALAIKTLIDSFAITSVTLNPKDILLNLQFNVPDTPAPPAKAVMALTAEELTLLEKKLNALDAFMTFIIRQFLSPKTPDALRIELLENIIVLRYEVINLLAEPETIGADPVKQLFITSWQQIAPLVREITKSQDDQTLALHYLTFIAANDVLFTIEQLGPSLGIDVSIDGLRRLARLLNSNPAIDPLETIEDEIPEFRFHPENSGKTSSDIQRETIAWLDFFIAQANATITLDKATIDKLNNWVPKKKEMNKYLPMVQQVLTEAIDKQLKVSDLDANLHKLYRSLVYAAAWQETCWRQYEVVKGQRAPLKSYSGDLGIMQINPRAWRGFYSVKKIKWDIVYNANAGAEILMHYLQHYALRKNEHTQTGKVENLARSSYSSYNGGPKNYARYRSTTASKYGKQVDKAFYEKFLAVYNGDAMAVKACFPGI